MLLDILYSIIPIIIPMYILYIANYKFNIKQRLLSRCASIDSYRAIILLVYVFIWMIFSFVLERSFPSTTFGQIALLSSLYLAHVPEKRK